MATGWGMITLEIAKSSLIDYPSGVYFYKIQFGDFTDTKKMTLVK